MNVAARVALGAMSAWAVMHVLGGAILVVSSGEEGVRELGSSVAPLGADPGPVVGGLVGFHGWNVAAGSLAVLVLAARAWGTRWPRGVASVLLIMAVLDAGLVIFLLAPGYLRWSDGVWGLLLLGVAVVSTALALNSRSGPVPDRNRRPPRRADRGTSASRACDGVADSPSRPQ